MKLWDQKDALIIAQVIKSVSPDSVKQTADLIVEAAKQCLIFPSDLQDAINRAKEQR